MMCCCFSVSAGCEDCPEASFISVLLEHVFMMCCDMCSCCFVVFQFRLVVKTALKLLLVFVEYTETNTLLLVKAIRTVDKSRGKIQQPIRDKQGHFWDLSIGVFVVHKGVCFYREEDISN